MSQQFPHDRQQSMARLIAERGSLTIEDLVRHFESSAPTIRRDLTLLERAGLASRTHGGVISPGIRVGKADAPFLDKLRRHHGAKRRIGRAAAAHVENRQTIFIDSGTTALALAQRLAGRSVTIVTVDLKVAEAASVGNTQVHIVGGLIRNGIYSIAGDAALKAVSELKFDTFFMTADALDLAGVSNSSREAVAIAQLGMKRARRTILISDHSKLGQRSLVKLCPLSALDLLITDRVAAPVIEPYRQTIQRVEMC
ncbi:DeoR/GlpR transcriptional regulator [Aureimonas fodinaquatilis]|uniref:DeoR/GlpR transcriptional regulator n=1 Tax=Aureimonas fodinaquatilis TaxID=2565783 RepID=A0A5B0DU52_9HYPH|nr:DeoR/GlpR family DNA-binding transcription regulator [Aureimonas fodinaquatilis]KAA0970337.1 DeoR/GlpR transcriptional regulator [Aureimonas fodinaquatilis]